jgi:hypothetical protein
VTTFQETQRADETVLFQQAFLLPPGDYTASVVVRDPGGGTFSRAEEPITIPAYPRDPLPRRSSCTRRCHGPISGPNPTRSSIPRYRGARW